MSNHTAVSRAKFWISRTIGGTVAGAFGATLSTACVLIGDPTGQVDNAQCILDYDECINLGVGAEICQAIHDECSGAGEDSDGQTGGPDPTGGCWDDVQHCLEESNGDEQQCADLIQQCEGGDDGGEPPNDGGEPPNDDDGEPSCWDAVEQCYDMNADPHECEALAEMCGGADGGEGPGVDPCQQAVQDCLEMGGDEQQCYEAVPGCECPPDDPQCNPVPDDCEVEYQQCVDSGQSEDECHANLDQCLGGGPEPTGEPPQPDYVCDDILEHCYQDEDLGDICGSIAERCFDGEATECTNAFFECAQVDPGQEQWQAPSDCYVQLQQCLG